jgi:hypothetical protein
MISLNKKPIIVAVIIFTLFVILPIIITVLTSGQINNQIIIGNYDKYVKSLPQDRRTAINEALYNIVKSSPASKKADVVKDAVIREGSYTESYNKSSNIYSSTFIVDIASIKQSYKVIFSWSKNANTVLNGDVLRFDCLPKDQLKYGDFKCNEILNIPTISSDPILQYLPYSTFNYKITIASTADKKIRLNIRIYLYSSDISNGNSDQAIDQYKKESTAWIQSKGLNINNYSIDYIIN